MLVRFRVENFRSFKEEQELSLVASAQQELPGATISVDGFPHGLLRAAAIYGANASGKTNVLRAVQYMRSAVLASQRAWNPEGPIPREPFLLDDESSKSASMFEVDLLVGGVRYQYGFRLDSDAVLQEWLYSFTSGDRHRRQALLERDGQNFKFGRKLPGENRSIEALTRRNSLFLSAAAQNNHEFLLSIYNWFSNELTYVPRERSGLGARTADICAESSRRGAIAKLLSAADLGVVGLAIRERDLFRPTDISPDAPEELKKVSENLNKITEQLLTFMKSPPEKVLHEVSLSHRSKSEAMVEFLPENESDGTLAFLALLGPMVLSLESGGTLCVDELDASLHPLLAIEIVHLFNDPERNPKGAQLIFTTHDTNLLGRSLFRRDQIWFTEKDSTGATHLYPLSDFRPKKDENLQRGYLQGRYGAVPFVGPVDFLHNEAKDA